MIFINIAAIVVAIAVVVLVAFLVPLIRELRTSAVALREIAVRFETDIEPAIRELNKALVDLNVITSGTADRVEDIQCFMAAVGDTGRGLRTISSVVSGAAGAFTKSSLWLTGAKVAGSFMFDKLAKKGGK